VAGFFGTPPMNFFNGRVIVQSGGLVFEEVLESAAGKNFRVSLTNVDAIRVKSFEDRVVTMGLRPEDIRVTTEPLSQTTIEVDLELVESLGHETWLHLATAGHEFVARARPGDEIPKPGRVAVNFDLSRVHFFDPTAGQTLM